MMRKRDLKPEFSREQVERLAREECIKMHWLCLDPIEVTNRCGYWRVWTNADNIGCNAFFLINQDSGEIVRKYYINR